MTQILICKPFKSHDPIDAIPSFPDLQVNYFFFFEIKLIFFLLLFNFEKIRVGSTILIHYRSQCA